MLVELDVLREGVREAAHEGHRVHERPARGVDRAREVLRAKLPGEAGSLDPLEGLAEPRERVGEGVEVLRDAAIGDRRLVLPLLAPIAVDPVGLDLLLQMHDRRSGEPHVAERTFVLVRRTPDGVREVDREPRVPSRGPVRRGGRVDDDDPVRGAVLGQPARRGEAGPSGSDHDPVRGNVAGESGPGEYVAGGGQPTRSSGRSRGRDRSDRKSRRHHAEGVRRRALREGPGRAAARTRGGSGGGAPAGTCRSSATPPRAAARRPRSCGGTRSDAARSSAADAPVPASTMSVAAASHRTQPRTTWPISDTGPPSPGPAHRMSMVTRSPQRGLSTVAEASGASRRPLPLARWAALMIAA